MQFSAARVSPNFFDVIGTPLIGCVSEPRRVKQAPHLPRAALWQRPSRAIAPG